MSTTAPVSTVEQAFLAASGHSCLQYQGEHTPVLEVKNVYELGKIVSQRFLEWVRENPSGVVALPTGKTPEFFIKTLERYRQTWDSPATQVWWHS